jgi:purine-nucleoside/S-methyl-5'-thioadenosine phosphorylase / adenosine deaminase
MVITVPSFADARQGVRHFFGTRRGPTGSDRAVRAVVSVHQVHGTDVLVIDRPVAGTQTFEGGWDALVTDQPGVLLTVRTADCVPVLIHDPVHGVAAAVHAGWRGAIAGIVSNTLAVMRRRFGSQPASLRMSIGPSVGSCCYEVDEPVLSRLRAGYADWRSLVQETKPGSARLNLRGLVRGQAQSAGVREDGIHGVSLCTSCHPDLFYSYRRDGTARGTMVSGIMLAPRRRAPRRPRGKPRAD